MIIILSESYIVPVVQLHLNNLRSPFKGKPGIEILKLYYNALIRSDGGSGFVALKDTSVIGYICGIWDPNLVMKRLLTRSWYKLLYWGIYSCIVDPKLLYHFILRLMPRKKFHHKKTEKEYELRPIVVDLDQRGKGFSSLLLKALIEDAIKHGYKTIYLKTENDNLSAQRFYEKEGFKRIENINESGRSLYQYKYCIIES